MNWILVPPYDSYFIASIPMFIASILIIRLYNKTKYSIQFFMATTWFTLGLFYLLNVLGWLFSSNTLIYICSFMWIPIGIFMIFMLDSTSRDGIDPKKASLLSILCTLLSYSAFGENSIVMFPLPTGGYGWDWDGMFKISVIFITIFVGVGWFFYCIKIYINSPSNLKKNAAILLIGSFLLGIFPLILFITNFNIIWLGSESISMTIGSIICSFAIAKQPQLAFILPFKASKLVVINTSSGIPLFSHTWETHSNGSSELLFSGMIQGISCILNEAVNKGYPQEIKLDNAVLLIQRSLKLPLAFIIVSTKSSKTLLDALKKFGELFEKKFENENFSNLIIDRFNSAEKEIEVCFHFVPNYD